MDRFRMDESDLEPEDALPWLGVDQLDALSGEIRERCAEIVDLVGDVMHAGPSPGEKSPDGRVVPERSEQLDATLAHLHRRRFDALLLDALAALEPRTEHLLVRPHRLVEIRDGDADVVDSACFHSGDATAGRSGERYEVRSIGVTACGTPTDSEARDSDSTPARSSTTSSRRRVSFSSSKPARRSSQTRCFWSSRTASA